MRTQKQVDLDRAEELDENPDADLTSWETGFLESILKRMDSGLPLTVPQRDTLNVIYEREMK